MLRPDAADLGFVNLRDFRKFHSMSQDSLLVLKVPGKELGGPAS